MQLSPKNIIMTLVGFAVIAALAQNITDVINITTGNALVDMAIPLMVALFFVGAALSYLGR